MANETLEFDASGSAVDGTNPGSPLVLMSAASNYYVTNAEFPAPPASYQYATSVDTEGGLPVSGKFDNRTITLVVEPKDTASSNTHLDALRGKYAKVMREGGTLTRVLKDGSSTRIFDLLASDGFNSSFDIRYENGRPEVTMTFTARPYTRGTRTDLGDNTETTLPSCIFTEASIAGDVDGLGELVIDNDGSIAWWGVAWGGQSRYYDSAASAALFYQAESRTAMGGSATAVGPSGASGSSSNVMRNTALLTSYQAVLSTQASGGGAHLSHVGTFNVWARIQVPATNTGTVSVALEWAEGDFSRFQQNVTRTIDASLEGSWVLVHLGLVAPRKVISGTQRWEGRVLAKSTVVGDDIDIDTIELIPADEGSGVAQAVMTLPTATSITGRDEFTGLGVGSGLNARSAPAGGSWATGGSATDFVGNAGFPSDGVNDVVARGATGTRFAVLGSTNYTTSAASIGKSFHPLGNTQDYHGLVARYVDTSNYLAFRYGGSGVVLEVVIAGTATTLDTVSLSSLLYDDYAKLTVAVTAAGDVTARFHDGRHDTLLATLSGSHPSLATGGTLATGKLGLIDFGSSSGGGPYTKYLDDFTFWVPPVDAGVFAGQSLQVRHDGVFREDSAGTTWQPVSNYEGDYLRVPPAGAEARTYRVIVRPIYHPPSSTGVYLDDRIDDMSARLWATPRYL